MTEFAWTFRVASSTLCSHVLSGAPRFRLPFPQCPLCISSYAPPVQSINLHLLDFLVLHSSYIQKILFQTCHSCSSQSKRPLSSVPSNTMEQRPFWENLGVIKKLAAFMEPENALPSLSRFRLIQSTTSHPASLRSNLIQSPRLGVGFPRVLFPSGFPTKPLYAFSFSPKCTVWPAPCFSRS